MTIADIIGSAGVFILLVAFILNLLKKITADSWSYLLLNFSGAAISGIASLLIPYWPFVVLELVWCAVAVFGMMNRLKSKN